MCTQSLTDELLFVSVLKLLLCYVIKFELMNSHLRASNTTNQIAVNQLINTSVELGKIQNSIQLHVRRIEHSPRST